MQSISYDELKVRLVIVHQYNKIVILYNFLSFIAIHKIEQLTARRWTRVMSLQILKTRLVGMWEQVNKFRKSPAFGPLMSKNKFRSVKTPYGWAYFQFNFRSVSWAENSWSIEKRVKWWKKNYVRRDLLHDS